jgi:hypothetical protein
MNEQNILAQSDAMRSSGLEAHGFPYINLDAGWSGTNEDYRRSLWNATAFPHFLDMIQHIHANGQKVGIYLLSGIGTPVYSANLPIFGTPYHAQDKGRYVRHFHCGYFLSMIPAVPLTTTQSRKGARADEVGLPSPIKSHQRWRRDDCKSANSSGIFIDKLQVSGIELMILDRPSQKNTQLGQVLPAKQSPVENLQKGVDLFERP